MEKLNKYNVEYKISTYLSKFDAYQFKKQNNGEIKLFISTIWKDGNNHYNDFNFDLFVDLCCYFTILERICLERGFQKIRMKNRCKPECKMSKYAKYIFDHLYR